MKMETTIDITTTSVELKAQIEAPRSPWFSSPRWSSILPWRPHRQVGYYSKDLGDLGIYSWMSPWSFLKSLAFMEQRGDNINVAKIQACFTP